MPRTPFQPGEPAPWFIGDCTSNPAYHFDSVAGRYIVLTFFGSTQLARSRAALEYLTHSLRPRFDDSQLAYFGVSVDPQDRLSPLCQEQLPGIRFFWDADQTISQHYRAISTDAPEGAPVFETFTLVLDPLLRVMAEIPLHDAEAHNRQLTAVLDGLPPVGEYAGPSMTAPVLVVPRVFEPAFCQALIATYQRQGGGDSGFMRTQAGQTVGVIDHTFKRRQDVILGEEPEYAALKQAIQLRIRTRLVPEIRKAFQFPVSRLERYLIACYDGDQAGFFRAHRDNTTPATAHRRFALTINLNAEDYTGGDLVFPEFGPRIYRAPTGGAVVFSCSLLHEATPVTHGKRYAFLPFLYDESAAEIRQENARTLSGETIRVT